MDNFDCDEINTAPLWGGILLVAVVLVGAGTIGFWACKLTCGG